MSCWSSIFLCKGWIIGRTLLLIQALSFAILVAVWRFTFSVIALPQRLEKRIMIIGAGKSGRYFLQSLREQTGMRFLARGFRG